MQQQPPAPAPSPNPTPPSPPAEADNLEIPPTYSEAEILPTSSLHSDQNDYIPSIPLPLHSHSSSDDFVLRSTSPPRTLHQQHSPAANMSNFHTPDSTNFSQHRRSPSPISSTTPPNVSPMISGDFTFRRSSPSPPSSLHHSHSSLSSTDAASQRQSPSPPSSLTHPNLSPLDSGDFRTFRHSSPSPPSSHSSLSSGDFAELLETLQNPPSPPIHHQHSSVRHSSSSPPPSSTHHRRSSLPAASQLQSTANSTNAGQTSAAASTSVPHQPTPSLQGDAEDDQNIALIENDDDDVNEGNNPAEGKILRIESIMLNLIFQ